MRNAISSLFLIIVIPTILSANDTPAKTLTIDWKNNYLTIHGDHLPGKEISILYLEAYCRDHSHQADWVKHTVVGHSTKLISKDDNGKKLHLRCTVKDGVIVDHVITALDDEIQFKITAKNPTEKQSETHWAQPCIRVGKFTGTSADQTDDKYAYIKKSFVFLDGKLTRMPTPKWATQAKYVPGQVWAGPGISRDDVNPRPLHPDVPSNGLIGCFSADEKMIFAVAFDPYQELFQGVIRCLHSDFRVGGLKPGQALNIKGRIYIVANDVPALLKRYHKDFPNHRSMHHKDDHSKSP